MAYMNQGQDDAIRRITVDYHRTTKIKSKEEIDGDKYLTRNYMEHLLIDRETNTIEFIQSTGTGCKVSHKYEFEGGIEYLFDNSDAESLFADIIAGSDDVIETPENTKYYTITIDYYKGPQRVITGIFDKEGLPADFAEFAEDVDNFLYSYDSVEMINPSFYGKARHHGSEYIYCSVEFDEGCNTYYYIADDDSIEIGDYVIVPAGKDNHHAIVRVVDIEYYSEEYAPFPVEKTKHVIRKCTDDDFDPPMVMASEPLMGQAPDQLRQKCSEDGSERTLAEAYAGASNQMGWLMHDLDEEDCPEDTVQRYHDWKSLEEELRDRIFEILKNENSTELGRLASEGKGYYYMVKPFMVRNGYKDSSGWWIKES